MKIATFNVNSIRTRLPIVLDWLRSSQADVLAVQETKVQDPDFPAEPIEALGYQVVFRGQKSYNGVALISKAPIEQVRFGLEDEPYDESRLLDATVRGLRIINTYVPQGQDPDSDKFQYKLQWFKRLHAYFERHVRRDDPVIWLGDLNVAPEPMDVYDPKKLAGHVCFCPEVTKALYEVMAWRFVDLFREFNKDGDLYSFWDYRGRDTVGRNHGWRIDHVMGTAPILDKSTGCTIDKAPRLADRPSDHTPVILSLNWDS